MPPAAQPADAWWVDAIRRAALVVFPALVLFCLVAPARAGRVFWTVVIAALPFFVVVVGYHRWRRICPLAALAQLPGRLGRGGTRRAGSWVQAHSYQIAFTVFLVSLWLRLVATNGDGYALALFVGFAGLAAVAVGALFTGKTWCNYICPVSFVEKIYTEPRGLRETPNSQCPKCTACKPSCPDINEENAYWKEIGSADKRLIYYAFPGVVFAFYFYYWLQAGTWDYYYSGRWTADVGRVRTAFLPGADPVTAGFYFWPAVPRAVASAATLVAGALVSYLAFAFAERRLGPVLRARDLATDDLHVRHLGFTVAAFTAFVTFYAFAGQPTLRLLGGAPHVWQVAIVTTATLFLVRRLTRRQAAFAEETLARKIIARWEWQDVQPPRDLREAFLIHTIRSQSRADAHTRMIDLYKAAVREAVQSGVVTRADVQRLDSLRDQLRISEADHQRVMADLDEEARALIGDPTLVSPEKQLQLETYAGALGAYLERLGATGAPVDDRMVRELRSEYGVTEDEHARVFERLLQSREGIAAQVLAAPAAVEAAAAVLGRVGREPVPAVAFLGGLLRRRWTRAVDGLLKALGVGEETEAGQRLRVGLFAEDAAERETALRGLAARLSPKSAARLAEAQRDALARYGSLADLAGGLRAHLDCPDPYIRAAAIFALDACGAVTADDLAAVAGDPNPLVAETAAGVDRRRSTGETLDLLTVEKMIALRSVGIFDALEPEDLAGLARAGVERRFRAGEALCREGEPGDEVFVLLDGEVNVYRRDETGERMVGVEGRGRCIGELAVLDPAPRAATVVAADAGVRTLSLDGQTFRNALGASPAVSQGIIRTLARRLRGAGPGGKTR